MATPVDKAAVLNAYGETLTGLEGAERLGRQLSSAVDRVYFVACGGPNRLMLTLQYWLEHYSGNLEVRRYFPAEFMAQNPARFDERTLVVLGSKSGTTPETLEAAEFLHQRRCRTVAVTTSADLPLAKAVQNTLLTGKAEGATAAQFMNSYGIRRRTSRRKRQVAPYRQAHSVSKGLAAGYGRHGRGE